MRYYIRQEHSAVGQGPFTAEALVSGIVAGSIPKDWLASSDIGESFARLRTCREKDWFPFSDIPDLEHLVPPPPPEAESEVLARRYRRSGMALVFVCFAAAAAIITQLLSPSSKDSSLFTSFIWVVAVWSGRKQLARQLDELHKRQDA